MKAGEVFLPAFFCEIKFHFFATMHNLKTFKHQNPPLPQDSRFADKAYEITSPIFLCGLPLPGKSRETPDGRF